MQAELDAITRKYDLKRKASLESNLLKASSETASKDFEEMLQSPPESSPVKLEYLNIPQYSRPSVLQSYRQIPIENLQDASQPKSAASALRALQDKLRDLETENYSLKQSIQSLEDKSYTERERLHQKYYQDISYASDKEKSLYNRMRELEDNLAKQTERANIYEEKYAILETQCSHLKEELKRNTDIYRIEKENWTLQFDHYERLLRGRTGEDESLTNAVNQLENEKALLQEEVKQLQHMNSTLQAELDFLQQNTDSRTTSLRKNLHALEEELNKQREDNTQKIQQLEAHIRGLNAQIEQKDRQITYLKREVDKFVFENKIADSAKTALNQHTRTDSGKLNTSSTSQLSPRRGTPKRRSQRSNSSASRQRSTTPKRTEPKSPRISNPFNRHIGAHLEDQPSRQMVSPKRLQSPISTRNKERFESEDEIAKSIENLEKVIKDMNRKYKDLLQRCHEEKSDLAQLRNEINGLAKVLEEKSNDLYLLKKRQASLFRDKLNMQ